MQKQRIEGSKTKCNRLWYKYRKSKKQANENAILAIKEIAYVEESKAFCIIDLELLNKAKL